MGRSSRKLDVVALSGYQWSYENPYVASPDFKSRNKRELRMEIRNLKKENRKAAVLNVHLLKIMKAAKQKIQEFSNENPSSNDAAAAASPDFKSGNKRGVKKLNMLKKKIINKAAVLKARKAAKQKIQEFSNENPSSNDPTTPSVPQMQSPNLSKTVTATKIPYAPQMQSPNLSKTVTARNIPLAIQKFEISLFFGKAGEVVNTWYDERVHWEDSEEIFYDRRCCHIEFATEEAAKKALELDGRNFGNRKIVVDRYGTTTGASKTLIARHLSIFITKSDVFEFFKRFGEIIDVRFSSSDHEFSKHCHIEFATEEGAKKAAELNGSRWVGHLLELGFSREIIRVSGFDTSIEFDEINSSLDKLFSKECGRILWMKIPTAPKTNTTLGEAFIELYDIRKFPKALALNGHKLGNSTLRVEDATPDQLDVNPPGPRRKIDGRPVGPYFSHSYYPSRFLPHRGWYNQGIGKDGGILSSAYLRGKKTIFDDDCVAREVDKRDAVRIGKHDVHHAGKETISYEDDVALQLDGAGIGEHDVHSTGKEIISYDDCPDGRKVDKRSALRVGNAVPLQFDGAGIGKHDVHRTGKKTIFDDDCAEGRKVDPKHDDGAGIGKHDVHRTGKKTIFDDDCPGGREVDIAQDDGVRIGKHDKHDVHTRSIHQFARVRLVGNQFARARLVGKV